MRYDFLIFYNFNKNLDCNVGKLIINSQSIIFPNEAGTNVTSLRQSIK